MPGIFLFSTYVGGEGADDGNVVRVDSAGIVYIGGDTMSTAFPATSGALQGKYNGGYDGFVCGVANDGCQLLFATYLGGSGADSINDLFIGQDGRIVVAGFTASQDFPVVRPLHSVFGGSFDGFLAVLGGAGKTLDFATYLGGGGDDRAYGVAPLGNGQLVVAGQVLAGTVPYMQRQFSSAVSGNQDGFFAAVSYPQPLRFVPITPCRLADTRNPAGPFGGPAIAGGSSRDFVLPAGACGVLATAQAYSLNVAVMPAGPLDYQTIWPTGQTKPLVSTLNSDGRVKSNAAIVPAGTDGAISTFTSNTTDLVLDINGYFVPADLRLARVLSCGPLSHRGHPDGYWAIRGPSLLAQQVRTLPIWLAGGCNIAVSAQAYSVDITSVAKGPIGYLTAGPSGTVMPVASTLNAPVPVATANAAIVPVPVIPARSTYSPTVPQISSSLSMATLHPRQQADCLSILSNPVVCWICASSPAHRQSAEHSTSA